MEEANNKPIPVEHSLDSLKTIHDMAIIAAKVHINTMHHRLRLLMT